MSFLLHLCQNVPLKRYLFFLFASQPVSWSRYIKAGNGSNKRDKQRKCLQTPIHAAVKRKCQIVNIIDMVCNLSISITYLGLSISFSIFNIISWFVSIIFYINIISRKNIQKKIFVSYEYSENKYDKESDQ